MIRIFEAFSGYGSQLMQLKRSEVEHKSAGISEIDEAAILTYSAIHCLDKEICYPEVNVMLERLIEKSIGLDFKTNKTPWEAMLNTYVTKGTISPNNLARVKNIYKACTLSKNYGDISKIDPKHLPTMDLFTYSFPCTDISMAGKQEGLQEGSGTRSSLLWECEEIIEAKRPKYLMMENVKNLVGKQHKPDFDRWLKILEELGYNNYWKVINAKHCGVPQNRERVFCVSILKSEDKGTFKFYDDFDSGIRLKDILEDNVDEKYYLQHDKIHRLLKTYTQDQFSVIKGNNLNVAGNIGNTGHGGETVYNPNGITPTLLARDYKDPKRIIVESNNLNMVGMLDMKGNESIRRVYDSKGLSPALTTMQGGHRQPKIVEACAIRGRNPVNPKSRESGLETVQMLEVSKFKDVSNCLTTVQKDSMVLEKTGYEQRSDEGLRFFKDDCIGTIRTIDAGGHRQPKIIEDYRIRKLTPRECFRLMGVYDSDIDKIQATGISNSQQYKMAGNSIVVDCMKFLDQLE